MSDNIQDMPAKIPASALIRNLAEDRRTLALENLELKKQVASLQRQLNTVQNPDEGAEAFVKALSQMFDNLPVKATSLDKLAERMAEVRDALRQPKKTRFTFLSILNKK